MIFDVDIRFFHASIITSVMIEIESLLVYIVTYHIITIGALRWCLSEGCVLVSSLL